MTDKGEIMDETEAYIQKMEALMENRLEGINWFTDLSPGDADSRRGSEAPSELSRKLSSDSGGQKEAVITTIPTIEIDQEHVSASAEDEDEVYESPADAEKSAVQQEEKSPEVYYRENNYDESEKKVLETFASEAGIESPPIPAKRSNDDGYEYSANEDAAESGLIRAKSPQRYYKDEGYDKVIAEMAAKKNQTPEDYIESLHEVEQASRRSSVASNASEVKGAALSRTGSMASKKSSRRASNASQVGESNMSRTGSVKSHRRQSSASVTQEDVTLSRQGSIASRHSTVKDVTSRRESTSSVIERESIGSRKGSISSRRESTGTIVPDEETNSRRGSQASVTVTSRKESTTSAEVNGDEVASSRRSSVASRRDSNASAIVNGKDEVTSRRSSVVSRRESNASAIVNGDEVASRRSSVVSRRDSNASAIVNGDEVASRRSSVVSRRDSNASAIVNGDEVASRRSSVASGVVNGGSKAASRRSSVASQRESDTSRRSSQVSIKDEAQVVVIQPMADYSQEHEDAFEARVRNNIRDYRSEKSLSNSEVLYKIGNEEDGPSADVKALLAWAKATKKKDTDSMVVRKKQHVEKIKRASDFSLASVFLATKEPIKEEEPVEEIAPVIMKPAKETKVVDDLIRSHEVETLARQLISSNIIANNINITNTSQDTASVTFDGEIDGKTREFVWQVSRSSTIQNQEKVSDTIKMLENALSGSKLRLSNVSKILHSDSKMTIVDASDEYKALDVDKQLDEIHLKVGMKALARLHAYTFLHFKKNPGLSAKFGNNSFTDAEQKLDVKNNLENKMVGIAAVLDNIGEELLVNNVNNLKGMVFNIFKEANTSPSVMACLAHGMPTLANLEFKYFDSMPIDARLTNFDSCNYGSGIPDLHTFINTSGENMAREDFLLRFVYYETLAATLKSQGEKINFTYDDMKTEFVQKRLHGYLQSAAILSGAVDAKSEKVVSTPEPVSVQKTQTRPGPMKPVESKILGAFNPTVKAKVMAVSAIQEVPKKKVEVANGHKGEAIIGYPADRIAAIMQKAMKAY